MKLTLPDIASAARQAAAPARRVPTQLAAELYARIVFVLILCFGSVMVFLVPPIQAPDEAAHLLRIVMLSEGRIFPQHVGGAIGQEVPDSLGEYVDRHMAMAGHPDQHYSYGRWYLESHDPSPRKPRHLRGFSTHSTAPLMYLPQLAGVLAGKLAASLSPSGSSLSWPAILYLGRFANLLAYAIGVLVALRCLPAFQRVVGAVALLPMTLHLAASLSYDTTPLLAALALFTACLRAMAQRRAPHIGESWVIILAAFMLGSAKLVYTPSLLILAGLLPGLRVRDLDRVIVAPLLAAIAGGLIGTLLFGAADDPGLSHAMAEQAHWLLHHGLALPRLILHSLVQFRGYYAESMVANLGWLDTNFPLPFIGLLYALLGASLLLDTLAARGAFAPLGLLCGAGGAALSATAVMLALYVLWTPVVTGGGIGHDLVLGVQGRYFLPLLPFAALLPAGLLALLPPWRHGWPWPGGGDLQLGMLAVQTGALLLTLVTVLLRYWIA